jgi:hypothetical protein
MATLPGGGQGMANKDTYLRGDGSKKKQQK